MWPPPSKNFWERRCRTFLIHRCPESCTNVRTRKGGNTRPKRTDRTVLCGLVRLQNGRVRTGNDRIDRAWLRNCVRQSIFNENQTMIGKSRWCPSRRQLALQYFSTVHLWDWNHTEKNWFWNWNLFELLEPESNQNFYLNTYLKNWNRNRKRCFWFSKNQAETAKIITNPTPDH